MATKKHPPRGKAPRQAPRNEAARPHASRPSSRPATGRPSAKSAPHAARGDGANGGYWLYGWHAIEAALANPDRHFRRLIAAPHHAEKLTQHSARSPHRKLPAPEVMEPRAMDHLLGADAVHQGIAALVLPLPQPVLEDVLHLPAGCLLVLDQVSDPHNVGAMLRSAAAFEATALIAPKDHSAPETATMAKAASGGLEIIPRITVTNLASALRNLQEAGWWVIGLTGEATIMLHTIDLPAKTVLVLGAEGRGMRRLTAESCDQLAKLPIAPAMESLNVSNAAAIALYQRHVQQLTRATKPTP